MRPSARCQCGLLVRDATTENGAPVRLHPAAVHDGYIWVLGYADGIPIVKVGGSAKDVPPTEPMRYRLHVCGYVPEPNGGA